MSYQTSCHFPSTSIPIASTSFAAEHDTVPRDAARLKTNGRDENIDNNGRLVGHAMRTSIRILRILAFAAIVACTGARAADTGKTIDLTIASSHSTSLAWVGVMHTLVVPETNRRLAAEGSPYRIRWTEAYGGSLYKYQNTLEAIEIGLTDMGWVGTLWELSKMPLQNVTYYAPFTTDDYHMIYEIFNELNNDAARDGERLDGAEPKVPRRQRARYVSPDDELSRCTASRICAATRFSRRARRPLGSKARARCASTAGSRRTTRRSRPASPTACSRSSRVRRHIASTRSPRTSRSWDSERQVHGRPVDQPRHLESLAARGARRVGEARAASTAKPWQTSSDGPLRAGLKQMQADGAIVTTLPIEEKRKWLDGDARISRRAGPTRPRRAAFRRSEVLRAYMDAVRARGGQPLRDWDRPN